MSDGSEPRPRETPRSVRPEPFERRDPLAPILAFGRRQVRVGALIGVAGALIVHAAFAGQAARTMYEIAAFAGMVHEEMRQRLRAQYDIDVNEPPPPPPPPPEPDAEPEPKAVAALAKAPPPPEGAPPPAVAQAGNLLTSDPDPNAPLDLTGDGFVVGTAEAYAGGITASAGTAKKAVRDARAAPTGTGQAPRNVPIVASAAPAVDRSRPPRALGAWAERCPFPAQTDAADTNHAIVLLTVTITADGRTTSASVVSESPPGQGFGSSARQCALREGRFDAAWDTAGNAVDKTTTIRMLFNR